MSGDCDICAKHRGEGRLAGGHLVWEDAHFRVYHMAPGDDGAAPLGRMYIEAQRHVPYLADLSDEESESLGLLRTRLARALREEAGVSFTFAAVVGMGVPHFHEHLIPRYPETTRDIAWDRSDEAAPRANAAEVADPARRIAARLTEQHEDGKS
jgi:diadenosine tetraphosphate (Ap4A) HIT family hydrolase